MTVEVEPAQEAASAVPESAKRKQILDGAREVFFSRGFDAASMGEIAREAKVSKGTLYVYFDSKEALFSALISEAKRETAERALDLIAADGDVAETLGAFGRLLLRKIINPTHVQLVRMVIGAADKFPALAQSFYAAGPAHGAACLAAWLETQHRAGRLVVADPQAAAWQFLGMCNQPVLMGVVLAARPAPDEAEIAAWVDGVVATFLRAYGPAAG
jgi:AcrR family transcriptional regulator